MHLQLGRLFKFQISWFLQFLSMVLYRLRFHFIHSFIPPMSCSGYIIDDWLAANPLKSPARESGTVVRRYAVLHQISKYTQFWFTVFELPLSTPAIIGSTFFSVPEWDFGVFFSLFTPPLQLHLLACMCSFLCIWLSSALLASIAWSIWVTMARCVLERQLSVQNVKLTIRVQVLSLFRIGTHPFPNRKTRFN